VITVVTALAGGAAVVAVEDTDEADDADIVTSGAAGDPLGVRELAPTAVGVIGAEDAVAVVARAGEPVPAAGDGAEPGLLAVVVLPAVCAPPTPEW
jgi:hypothetical protein